MNGKAPNMHNVTHGHFGGIIPTMSNTQTKKRKYNRMTPAARAKFRALEAITGNGSAAIRELNPDVVNVGNRAYRMRKKEQEENTLDFIDNQLQQIGVDAINRVGELVLSSDERVAAKISTYVIDHLRGQATKKSITLHGKANIQSVLD